MRERFLPKFRWHFTRLHCVISQKTVIFNRDKAWTVPMGNSQASSQLDAVGLLQTVRHVSQMCFLSGCFRQRPSLQCAHSPYCSNAKCVGNSLSLFLTAITVYRRYVGAIKYETSSFPNVRNVDRFPLSFDVLFTIKLWLLS